MAMIKTFLDSAVDLTHPKTLSQLYRATPRSFMDRRNDVYFRNVIKYAYQKSPFYRKKFDELGIDPKKVKCPVDLGNFFTNSSDIWEHAEEFLCRKPQAVFESSGTTGRNKRVYFSQRELNYIGKINATGYYLWGLGPDDRIVNAFEFSIWIPGIITQKGIEKSGMFGIAAGKIDPMEVYKRIPQYKINVVIGEPTWLIKLTEIAEKHGSYPLKLVIGGAEEMPDAARPWIEKVWQGAKVRMVYASVESGGVVGCELTGECGGYHIDENNFLVEVVNPDKDGYGEVVFTTLSRTTMPLIRYRNRDISKMLDEKCSCGIPVRRLTKMRGRSDELIVASGGNLYPLMFEDIFKGIEDMTLDWQIVFRLRGIKEVMEFNVELKDPSAADKVKERIFDAMKKKYPDLWKNLRLGIFDTEFVYKTPESIREGRKLIRLLDKRYVK